MELTLYQVDAFADAVFSGNPAAVVPLSHWLDDQLMLSIAAENNLAETAFFVPQGDAFEIRWFTPVAEVDLCGHATLASAYVLFNELDYDSTELTFHSKSGALKVTKRLTENKALLFLDFPSHKPVPCAVPVGLTEALGVKVGVKVKHCLHNQIHLVVLEDETQVAELKPDFVKILQLGFRGVIVTAPSVKYDFVNRYFAPLVGINEDSVTGSAFTKLIPYWSERLNKKTLFAKQVSQRGGEVYCELAEPRVKIGGSAVKYLQGKITV